MPVCAGYNCYKRIQRGTSLFKFPKNPKLCHDWLRCLGRTDLYDFSYNDLKNGGFRVCQKHFPPSFIYVKDGKTYLRKGALPSIQQTCTPAEILQESQFDYLYGCEEPLPTPITPEEVVLTSADSNPSECKAEEHKKSKLEADNTLLEEVSILRFCCIPMCNNNSKHQPHLGFHSFPSSCPQIRKAMWNTFLKTVLNLWGIRTTMPQNHRLLICSVHFKPDTFLVPPDVNARGDQVQLKPDAVPTIDPLFDSFLAARRKLQEEASNAAIIDRPVIEKKHVDGSVNEKKQDVQANAPAKPEPAKKLSISQESTNNASASDDRSPRLATKLGKMLPHTAKNNPQAGLQNTVAASPSNSYYLLPFAGTPQNSSQPVLLLPAHCSSNVQLQTVSKRSCPTSHPTDGTPNKIPKLSNTSNCDQLTKPVSTTLTVTSSEGVKPAGSVSRRRAVVLIGDPKCVKTPTAQVKQQAQCLTPLTRLIFPNPSNVNIAAINAQTGGGSSPVTLSQTSPGVTGILNFNGVNACVPQEKAANIRGTTTVQTVEPTAAKPLPGVVLLGKTSSVFVAGSSASVSADSANPPTSAADVANNLPIRSSNSPPRTRSKTSKPENADPELRRRVQMLLSTLVPIRKAPVVTVLKPVALPKQDKPVYVPKPETNCRASTETHETELQVPAYRDPVLYVQKLGLEQTGILSPLHLKSDVSSHSATGKSTSPEQSTVRDEIDVDEMKRDGESSSMVLTETLLNNEMTDVKPFIAESLDGLGCSFVTAEGTSLFGEMSVSPKLGKVLMPTDIVDIKPVIID